jgi:hypothetical protein
LVNADGREDTEDQAEGADKVPASKKKRKKEMTMIMMDGDGNGESDGDEKEDGDDDDDEIVDVDRMDGGSRSSADGRGGKPGAVT